MINTGEPNQFNPGDRAPNDGTYIEIGEEHFPTGIMNPRRVTLRAGERFPETSNHNRKWSRFKG